MAVRRRATMSVTIAVNRQAACRLPVTREHPRNTELAS